MAFPMTFAVLSAVLWIVAAQEKSDYVEVGQRLVLEVTPQDLSAIQKPIEIIRWKFNNDLVVDRFHPNPVRYYGRFKDRTHLDVSSLALAIEPVSLADGGKFHLETGKGPVRTFDVGVIKAPPKPKIDFKPLVCDKNQCAMKCSADTGDLGPVTYQWRPDDGVWTDGEELKKMDTADRSFICRLRTHLSVSPDSARVANPLFVEIIPDRGLTPGAIFGIVIAVIVVLVVIAAVAFIKFYPKHTVSMRLLRLKNSVIRPHKGQAEHQGGPDRPAPNGPTKEATAEEDTALLHSPPAENACSEQPPGLVPGQSPVVTKREQDDCDLQTVGKKEPTVEDPAEAPNEPTKEATAEAP
ncbi:hypothetical protein NHX12_000152 [Muraenolepis orangiensis]|uniref:Ig-like domain-containing protein n=1 Tax=Muraenolepis orangiensis TaxID=630683 RepID=A0A9Q0D9G6_9TELE|nr:hypothetical protein NHX12_000152 [Muraenolepis orangiensis]